MCVIQKTAYILVSIANLDINRKFDVDLRITINIVKIHLFSEILETNYAGHF